MKRFLVLFKNVKTIPITNVLTKSNKSDIKYITNPWTGKKISKYVNKNNDDLLNKIIKNYFS